MIDSSGPLMAILDEVIMTSQSATTLEAAHLLLRTFTSNPKIAGPLDTTEMLEEVLEGVGFAGLWRSSSFHVANVQERQCTALTDKLIEVSSVIEIPPIDISVIPMGERLTPTQLIIA